MKIKPKKQGPVRAFSLFDLKYESGAYWVWEAAKDEYYVMRCGVCVSESDSCYDSLGLAICRVDYLNKTKAP